MKHWRYWLALAGVIGIGFAAWAGQVPNPVNAPTSAIIANSLPYWPTTNAQQPAAIAPVNSAIFTTSSLGVPQWSTTILPANCPLPTVSTIGCIEAINSVSHEWVYSIDASGVPHLSQPGFGDISGLGTAAQQNTGTSGANLCLLNASCTFGGTDNFTGTFQIGGTAETFPASGNIVGTSDTQTLTNKSIAASEINSGMLAVAQGGTNGTTGKAAASNLSVPYLVCLGAPNNTLTGSTSLTQMNTTQCEMPANLLSTGMVVRVWTLWSATGSGGTKAVSWVWGTSNGTAGTSCFGQTIAAATNSSGESEGWVAVTGSSAEKCYGGGSTGTNSSALSSLALSVSSNIFVNFTAQLASGSDSVTLVAYLVEVMQSAGN